MFSCLACKIFNHFCCNNESDHVPLHCLPPLMGTGIYRSANINMQYSNSWSSEQVCLPLYLDKLFSKVVIPVYAVISWIM